MKRAALLLSVLLLPSCSSFMGTLSDEEISEGRNVGALSLLGSTFHGIHVGGTVFNNESYEAPVPDWEIDDFAEEFIGSQVAKFASARAAPIKHDAGLQNRFVKSLNFLQEFDYEEVLKLARAQGFDTLVLVQPTRYENAPFHEPGYGFYERTRLGGADRCVYSLFTVEVFSVSRKKRLAGQSSRPCTSGETAIPWKAAFSSFTDEERLLLRNRTEQSIRDGLAKALAELGYGPPPDRPRQPVH